jgi:hypothetical protein
MILNKSQRDSVLITLCLLPLCLKINRIIIQTLGYLGTKGISRKG